MHTRGGYFHPLKWKEANKSALSPAARTQKRLHTQRCLDYFGKPQVYYFVLWGRGGGGGGEGGGGGGGGGGCCFAAPPVIRWLCLCACEKGSSSKINTSSAQISSRVWRTCGEMSWFEDTLLVMDLTWTWPPASPNVMNVLFNLPVFVNLPLDKGTAVLWGWNNISSLAFGFWWCTIMTVIIEPHHRDLSQHPHTLTGAALYFKCMWVNCRDTDSNKHRRLAWLRTNL